MTPHERKEGGGKGPLLASQKENKSVVDTGIVSVMEAFYLLIHKGVNFVV
jgi:hypothetical protein